jgi:hypothetical protein
MIKIKQFPQVLFIAALLLWALSATSRGQDANRDPKLSSAALESQIQSLSNEFDSFKTNFGRRLDRVESLISGKLAKGGDDTGESSHRAYETPSEPKCADCPEKRADCPQSCCKRPEPCCEYPELCCKHVVWPCCRHFGCERCYKRVVHYQLCSRRVVRYEPWYRRVVHYSRVAIVRTIRSKGVVQTV